MFEPPYTTWHVGMIEGGTAHNIMAGDCKFIMSFRAVPGDDPDTRVVVIRLEEHTASCGGPDITWQSAGDGSLEVKVDVHEHSMEYAVISNSYRRGRSLGFGGRRLKNGGVR